MAHRYLLALQYLGYGYRGWQKQPATKTVQGTVERVLGYVVDQARVRTLAAGRTDAGVSADAMPVMVLLDEPTTATAEQLNEYLPPDIRALSWQAMPPAFSILEQVQAKEYRYRFAPRHHLYPHHAPFVGACPAAMDAQLLSEAAALFVGTHDFAAFAYQPPPAAVSQRTLLLSEVVRVPAADTFLNLDHWEYRVKGEGFMRHQVRLLVASLWACARGAISPAAITSALAGNTHQALAPKVPASGLRLHQVTWAPAITGE